MSDSSFPVPLARAALHMTPPFLLARLTRIALARTERRHPKLFKNLSKLPKATVHLMPTDLPHRFGLRLGEMPVSFYLLENGEEKADACIAGTLVSLVAMLEGREDGDALFFSRDIQVTGSTETIVGLRNTLDREELDLFEELIGLCGPFAQPARTAVSFLDRALRHVREKART